MNLSEKDIYINPQIESKVIINLLEKELGGVINNSGKYFNYGGKNFILKQLQYSSDTEKNLRRIQGVKLYNGQNIDIITYYPIIDADTRIISYVFCIWNMKELRKTKLKYAKNPGLKVRVKNISQAYEDNVVVHAHDISYPCYVYSHDRLIDVYFNNKIDKASTSEFFDKIEIKSPSNESGEVLKEKSKTNVIKINVDYESQHKKNSEIGSAGEVLVLEYEQERLTHEGAPSDIIDQISHIAKKQGDGYGYDVLSYEKNDKTGFYEQIFIEVKTTKGNSDQFYFSINELLKSVDFGEQYRIYRIKNIYTNRSLSIYKGSIESNFRYQALNYISL